MGTHKKVTDKEIRQLVIERLRTLPSGKQIAIGSEKSYSKEELISAVEEDSNLGKKIIEVELEFLRSMKGQNFYDEENTTYN